MKTIGIFVAALMIGCIPQTPPLKQLEPTPTVITNYKVGTTQSAGIGDPIFDVQFARKVPLFVALRSHDPGHVRFLPTPIKVQQGDRFKAVGQLESGEYVVSRSDSASYYRLVVTPDGRVLGYYYEGSRYGGGSWPSEPLFTVTEGVEGQERAFRAQMIYAGLSGSTVRATYREFTGDLIRPAFNQELQYNLAQDSTIAYKSIKIQVLEATNSTLRYIVRQDGGLPWLPR